MAPIYSAGDFADRVFYNNNGSREWGTLCKHSHGKWFSVDHVTKNGTPVVGPDGKITSNSELSDWSLINIDPGSLKKEDYASMDVGLEGFIAGYPASDRDGEIIPAEVYIEDSNPYFVWVEVLPFGSNSPAEGVLGGISGSCFIIGDKIAGVVRANGFSEIEGTSNTFAQIVPIHTIIDQVNGVEPQKRLSFLGNQNTDKKIPEINKARYSLSGD